ncbi:hypothetical protein Tco_0902313, partial [Tanacetum coccineum]
LGFGVIDSCKGSVANAVVLVLLGFYFVRDGTWVSLSFILLLLSMHIISMAGWIHVGLNGCRNTHSVETGARVDVGYVQYGIKAVISIVDYMSSPGDSNAANMMKYCVVDAREVYVVSPPGAVTDAMYLHRMIHPFLVLF